MLKKYSFYQKNKTKKGKSLCLKNLTGNFIFLFYILILKTPTEVYQRS